jgi:hypothetical protein
MNKFYILVFALFLSACGSQSQTESPLKPGDGCESLQPKEADVQYALNFGSDLFTESDWLRSYAVEELKVYISWTHRSIAAISDVSMLLFCDEAGTQDLSWYFTDETIYSTFADYDQTLIIKSCEQDALRLYELEAIEEDVRYDIRLWAQTLNKSRVLTVLIVFPHDESLLLEKYSRQFFPQLIACP